MRFLKNIFTRKDEPIKDYHDFWNWFKKHEKAFFNVVKTGKDLEPAFFDKLSPKLDALKDGYFFLTGMLNEHTAELVFTADGVIKNIAFVEELVDSAPVIPGWKFTALKPALDINDVRINMADYTFDSDTLSFYSNDHAAYPDIIDITVFHQDFNEDDEATITNGTYVFLDNYIGELNFATTVDNLVVTSPRLAKKERIPIGKLKDFLHWRQKEFIEKYEGTLQNTGDSEFSVLEADLENGNRLIATINTDLLNWDKKASHPWIVVIKIAFDGEAHNGMPDNDTYALLDDIEWQIGADLIDSEGYINIGRQTADGVRAIYFVCKDFRKPSKILHQITLDNPDDKITFDIYKDKYWKSFNRFNVV
jgi:Family of unknown function (DUF695)